MTGEGSAVMKDYMNEIFDNANEKKKDRMVSQPLSEFSNYDGEDYDHKVDDMGIKIT